MKGLLLRLSGLDADAENAVRVIGFFDRLIAGRAGLDALVRSTADLAGCPVGVHAPGQGLSLRAEPESPVDAAGAPPPGAATRELEGGVVVWVARTGAPIPLDDMLLERFAIATAILLEHTGVPRPELGDPALVELVLSEDAGTAERARALHLLGIGPSTRLRVLAVVGAGSFAGRSAVLGSVRAVLATELPGYSGTDAGAGRANGLLDGGRTGAGPATPRNPPPASLTDGGRTGAPPTTPRNPPPASFADGRRAGAGSAVPGDLSPALLADGGRAGIGPEVAAIDAARSWTAARTALRFTATAEPLVWWENLGVLAALDGQPGLAEFADVQALDRLAAESGDTLATLTALCATGSARKAAAVLHRHHSTMPARLARAEAVLGFEVDSPAGRFRLHLALMARRLRDNADLS